jgi:sec-independent protein translocase protein TatA
MGLFDSPTHLLIILVVLVVLFGSAKLPKAAKSMGEAMRIFKKESAKLHDEDSSKAEVQEWTPQQVAAPQPQVTQQQAAAAQPAAAPQPAAPQPAAPQQTTQEQMAALQKQMDSLQQQMTSAPQPTTAEPAPGTPSGTTQHTNQPG